jgi:hypothetical protein
MKPMSLGFPHRHITLERKRERERRREKDKGKKRKKKKKKERKGERKRGSRESDFLVIHCYTTKGRLRKIRRN